MLDCHPYLSVWSLVSDLRCFLGWRNLQNGAWLAGQTRTWLQEEMA